MITEDYVSFEIAKLLKEKGFDEMCQKVYMHNGQLLWAQVFMEGESFVDNKSIKAAANYNDWIIDTQGEYAYLCPTLQMAMKWLREDKKILISIFCHIDKGYWFCIQRFINSPYKFATSESIHRKEEILGKIQYYDTYEQACEAALKYSLENLI